MTKDKINIIVPLYNPGKDWQINLAGSIRALEEELKGTDFSVIVVNDGSQVPVEITEDLLKQSGNFRYYSYPVNKGKGHAVRYGINRSDADFYIYTDLDFPFGYSIISETYRVLKSTGVDIVIATRDNSYLRMLPLKRRVYSEFSKGIFYIATGFRIKDSQAGLKGLDNRAKKILAGTKTDGFLFEMEFLKESITSGLTYKFINVTCRPGTEFSNFRTDVVFREMKNFFKIFFNGGKQNTSDF